VTIEAHPGVFVYALFNIALLHALPISSIAQSNLPAADAARLLAGPAGDVSVTLFALFSVGTITSIGIMAQSRMLFAMSRDHLAPRALQLVARNGSPMAAVLTIGLIAAAMAWSGSYEPLLAIYAPLALASLTIDVLLIAAFVFEDPEHSVWNVLLLVAVLPIYWICRRLAPLPSRE
jgi:basic amino acid/polyamine antiporter, APA family